MFDFEKAIGVEAMFFAKKFSDLLIANNVLAYCAITLFLICLVIYVILLVFALIKNKIYEHIREIFTQIERIRSHSVKNYLLLAERISYYDETKKQKVFKWKKRLKEIYLKEVVQGFKDFSELLSRKESYSPNISNITFYRSISKKFARIEKEIFNIFKELYTFLYEENIYRERTIQIKMVFDNVHDNLLALMVQYDFLDKNYIYSLIKTLRIDINDLIVEIYEVDYPNAIKTIKKIVSRLIYLIDLLDKIPDLILKLQRTIPQKMRDMQIDYAEIPQEDYVSAIANKVHELTNKVKNECGVIFEKIKHLKYLEARDDVNKLFDRIKAISNSIQFGDRLYNVLISNTNFLQDKVSKIEEVFITLEKKFNSTQVLNKILSDDTQFALQLKSKFKKMQEKVYVVIRELRNDKDGFKKERLLYHKNNFLKATTEILSFCSDLKKLEKLTNKRANSVEKIQTDLIYVQSLVSQIEIKIKKKEYQIPIIANYMLSVVELSKKIETIKDELKNELNRTLTPANLSEKLDNLKDEIEKVNLDTNNIIFLDYISQELINFLERYITSDPGIDMVINTLEDLYSQKKFNELIGYWTKVMHSMKSFKRR